MFCKLKRVIKEGIIDLYHFGPLVAFAKVRWILSDSSLKSVMFRNCVLVKWLTKRYGKLIERYRNYQVDIEENETELAPVWELWWQGKETMPKIIQWCHNSKLQACGEHPLVLLDKNTVMEYVCFPACVWEQFEQGRLRIQHLADMIRVQLIKNHGGLWLDASIYCMERIPEEAFSREVFSVKCPKTDLYVSQARWTTFVIGGRRNNVLCSFLNDLFIEHCESKKPFIDYFMFDCAIAVAYDSIPAVREAIDSLSMERGTNYWLDEYLELSLDKVDVNEKNRSTFQKLAWKKWEYTLPGEDSFYEYLKKKEGST